MDNSTIEALMKALEQRQTALEQQASQALSAQTQRLERIQTQHQQILMQQAELVRAMNSLQSNLSQYTQAHARLQPWIETTHQTLISIRQRLAHLPTTSPTESLRQSVLAHETELQAINLSLTALQNLSEGYADGLRRLSELEKVVDKMLKVRPLTTVEIAAAARGKSSGQT